jgi:hypothetical protein
MNIPIQSRSTSADIAQHISERIRADAMADDVAEFHGLPRRHPADDAPSPGLTVWVIVFAAIVIGAAIGVMTLPATPAPYTGPGFEAACRGGC